AYAAPFVNFGSLVRAAWLWTLLLIPVLLAISWFLAPVYAALGDLSKADLNASTPVEFQLLSILLQLVMLPAVASIAVAWHRLILNRERPSGVYLRFDRSVGLYAAFLIAVQLLLIALVNLPEVIASLRGTSLPWWVGALAFVLVIAVAFIFGRLSLVLPPIALGRTDIGLGDAWRATQGNTWRLFWGPIVCLILLVLPAVMVFIVAGAGRTTTTVALTVMDLLTILAGVIGVGFLSFAYQHFFEGGDRRAD
ncbi:MAG: hypothetical protein ACREF4_13365, partial [Gammaproteobacteria bacterium]